MKKPEIPDTLPEEFPESKAQDNLIAAIENAIGANWSDDLRRSQILGALEFVKYRLFMQWRVQDEQD